MQTRASSSSRAPRRRTHEYDSDNDSVSSFDDSSSSSSVSAGEGDSLANKLPTLPDLRFEQSYLATIRDFLHEDRPDHTTSASLDEKHIHEEQDDHHHKVALTHSKAEQRHHELWLGNLRVEWFPILYVTVRDQLLSPLVQGAVWGLGGLLFTQFKQYLSARHASGGGGGKQGVRKNTSILRALGISRRTS